MQLLINAIPLLAEESGVGNYTRQISNAALAAHDFNPVFFYGYYSKKLREAVVPGHSWFGNLSGLARKGSLTRRICRKALQAANIAINLVSKNTWDCYFEPNFLLSPTLHAKSAVITIHDFSCFRFPQWHPEERVRHMEKHFWKSVATADHIITVSEAVRKEACKDFGINPERITAIPNGVDHALFFPQPDSVITALRQHYNLPAHFILYVGTLEPRKNIANLIRAHSQLPTAIRDRYPLLLIGSNGWNNSEIMKLIQSNRQYVHLMGYVPSRHLPAFYSAATIFAYPSWYEGFGLPAAEAMACGKAILTSTDPALASLCQDAALVQEPDNIDQMSENIRRLIEDQELRGTMEKAALKNAQKYSWHISGERHLQIFQNLGGTC